LSLYDQRSHLLAERGTGSIVIVVAACGHRMPWSLDTSAELTERWRLTCEALAAVQVPAPQFGNPLDSGRPSVEQPPRPISAPGGRPDTTQLAPHLPTGEVDGIPSDPRGYLMSFPVPDLPLLSADAAARALQEHFLDNADRGDDAANDEFVAEILRRIRALRATYEGSC
jgi:hypothetical protein